MLEFNELTPSLVARFMAAGHLPHFRRLHDESHVFVTDAEEEGENLNPWVQWVTVHSGLSAAEHGITRLSEGYTLEVKALWDLLSEAGLRVWVCGSMNARYDRPLNGYLLPDPWSAKLRGYPIGFFEPYYEFVRNAVQEHTNTRARLKPRDVFAFANFLTRHGLRPATIAATVSQLVQERFKGTGWKRAALMDRIQWDLFRHVYRKHHPHFSTFFINSTAHYQHTYWRNMEPELFRVRPSDAENARYGPSILYGYKAMDRLIGECMALAGPETTLLFCTALSQQPYLGAEVKGGRHYYRLIGPQVLTERIGLEDRFEYIPVMSDQAILRFGTIAEAERATVRLRSHRFGEHPAFHVQPKEADLMVHCTYTGPRPEGGLLTIEGSDRTIPFSDVFYEMNVLKSGLHHPDGMLWIRYPSREHVVHQDKVSIRAIAPAVLDLFGHPRPAFMAGAPGLAETAVLAGA
jgi:hypothetical protein